MATIANIIVLFFSIHLAHSLNLSIFLLSFFWGGGGTVNLLLLILLVLLGYGGPPTVLHAECTTLCHHPRLSAPHCAGGLARCHRVLPLTGELWVDRYGWVRY